MEDENPSKFHCFTFEMGIIILNTPFLIPTPCHLMDPIPENYYVTPNILNLNRILPCILKISDLRIFFNI